MKTDEVKIYFTDGTCTIIYVQEEEDIRNAIVDLCDTEGYDPGEILDFQIIATQEEEDE